MFQKPRFTLRLSTLAIVLPLLSVPVFVANAKSCITRGEEYTTLDGVENGGQALRSVGPDMANEIIAPSGCDIIIAGVVLEVKLQRRDLGSFDVFYSPINKSGQPFEVQVFATVSDSTLTRDFKRILVKPREGASLKQNQHYYIGIRRHVGALSTVILGNTVDPTVLKRKDVANGANFYNIKGQQPIANGVYEMHVIIE